MVVTIVTRLNRYSSLGEDYFYRKYGFPKDLVQKYFDVRQKTTEKVTQEYCHDVVTKILYKNYRLPAIDEPIEVTGKGEILALVDRNGKQSPCMWDDGVDIIIGYDVFSTIGRILSGQLEPIWKGIGKEKEEFVKIPFLDIYSDILFTALSRCCMREGTPLVYKSFWPEGKKFAVCLTHDVDEIRKTYQWITYPLRMIVKKDFKGLKNQYCSLLQKIRGFEPFWTFPFLLKMEKDLGVRSSFYFLNETGKAKLLDRSTWRHIGRRYSLRQPEVVTLIKAMHAGGWDVGLHGSFYSYRNPELLAREKADLETALGSKIKGTRQHNLNITIPETWWNQVEAGLIYDTTLGFNDTIGFRWGSCFPFQPFDSQKNQHIDLLEIPLIVEEIALFSKTGYHEHCCQIEDEVELFGGILTLLWHHSVMNEFEFPGWGNYYKGIILRCLEKNAWVTHAAAITDWWTQREHSPLTWNYEQNVLEIKQTTVGPSHYTCILPPHMKIKEISHAEVVATYASCIVVKSDGGNMADIRIELEG